MDGHAWWEKWGEQFDEYGGVIKWTDKWAEDLSKGSKWGDKWEERFRGGGEGTRSGETWRISREGERWSRTWGEEHGPGMRVRKHGKSTSGEYWDTVTNDRPWVERRPAYGWPEVVADSTQLLSIAEPTDDVEDTPGV
eukprot:CAMPEP_0182863894 /NCGR_PEP_ID=MMETSP0034_2-20130328/6890_1 /TAXON_ID=156128 /ORGANISM="Nephroselmis pyriformis, Strain CCMP717" /LENGTH=137 /DNA_ID=CAMNT_0024996137 /DNA_START=237 /DNA_END=650 /DNA_ORIENTATION=-